MLNRRTWERPGGIAPGLCVDMLKQPHILIAGETGSGKSVLINSLIYTALYKSPAETQLILIDPKRVELIDYKDLPHTISYTTEPGDIAHALNSAVDLMECRYKRMQAARQKKSTEQQIYIIIDEFADLMTTSRKETTGALCRLSQLGRAANLHLILATQRPTRDIITGQIKVNLDCRVALRCATAQDSRNILDRKGAETLPRYGYGYYLVPGACDLVSVPMINPSDIADRVQWWEKQNRPKWWRI